MKQRKELMTFLAVQNAEQNVHPVLSVLSASAFEAKQNVQIS
jgi:hypothetical protein